MSDLSPGASPSLRRAKRKPPGANGKPDPMQDLLQALQAMRSGDFSVRMTGDHLGIEGKIADTFNEIVAANQRMAQQLERVGQVVGREGKTRQRVKFDLSSGSWADMEGSVNPLIDDLLWPTREVTRAVAAVAQGDLLQTVQLDIDGRPLGGEFLQSANIVNTMIKQLSVFTSEVTRVAREVGTEGKLGGQAQVPEVTGVWKDLTESVNSMASNLTAQVRNIADVTIAVATSAMLRTWAVRLPAIRFTLSVKSFHVPATSGTCAWPPSFPSVPTSRATRVTSDVNTPSCFSIVLTMVADCKNSPCSGRPSTSRRTVCKRLPCATASTARVNSVVGQRRSSISVLTEASISPHAPLASPKVTRWRVLPSRPTTCPTFSSCCAILWLTAMMSLNVSAIFPATPVWSPAIRTVKSPTRIA